MITSRLIDLRLRRANAGHQCTAAARNVAQWDGANGVSASPNGTDTPPEQISRDGVDHLDIDEDARVIDE